MKDQDKVMQVIGLEYTRLQRIRERKINEILDI